MTSYKVAIVGAGPAGYFAALAGPPLEPPCAEGAVGTKQAKGLNA